jgi:hypothetical protein
MMKHSAITADIIGRPLFDVSQISALGAERASFTAFIDLAPLIRTLVQLKQDIYPHYGAKLFCDPAWEILLQVTLAHAEQRRITVSTICDSVNAPSTTVGRWLKQMTDANLLVRRASPLDARVKYVELSPPAAARMSNYLRQAARRLAVLSPRN